MANRVDQVLAKENMGMEVKRIYGRTRGGKEFAIVISQVVWYAVRVIVEDTVVERHEFFTRNKAEEFLRRRRRELENGIIGSGSQGTVGSSDQCTTT